MYIKKIEFKESALRYVLIIDSNRSKTIAFAYEKTDFGIVPVYSDDHTKLLHENQQSFPILECSRIVSKFLFILENMKDANKFSIELESESTIRIEYSDRLTKVNFTVKIDKIGSMGKIYLIGEDLLDCAIAFTNQLAQ